MTSYFIGGDFDAVKIGYTAGPLEVRLAAIQHGNHEELSLLASCSGDCADEADIHNFLSEDRIRPNGEWFRKSTGVLKLMDHVISFGEFRRFGVPFGYVVNKKREPAEPVDAPGKVRAWRESHGLNGSQFSMLVGVPRSTIFRIEKGAKPSSDTIEKLFKASDGALSFDLWSSAAEA